MLILTINMFTANSNLNLYENDNSFVKNTLSQRVGGMS